MKVIQYLIPDCAAGTLKMLMVLLGVSFLSGCQVLQSIDKGLYDVAEAVTETDRVTGQRALSTANRSQQIAQGNQYVEKMLQDERKKGRRVDAALDARQYQRLVRIFDRIHPVSHLRQERWKPVLIDRDSFNAFTTGGTYIVVHLGLMKQLNDAEVAAVVGHEIATVNLHLLMPYSKSVSLMYIISKGLKEWQNKEVENQKRV